MFKYKLLFLSLPLIGITLLFQNCGAPTAQSSKTNSSSALDIIAEPDAPTNISSPEADNNDSLAFKAGDEITLSNIPTTRAYLLEEFNAYKADNGFKAIALTLDGYGFMMFQRSGSILQSTSQEEANRRALEACQFTSNNRPCSLFAEGNLVKYDENRFLTGMKRAIDLNLTQYKPNLVPLITDAIRDNQLKNYNNGTTQKALALSITGGGGYRFGDASKSGARTKAVNNCESQPNNDVCFLYAVNGEIVLTEQALKNYFDTYVKEQ